MAIIAPFNGIMYNLNKITNINKVVSPPYDVISNSDQKYFYDKDPYNAIRLSFGEKKTGDSDWDNRYTRAADFFKKWLSDTIFRLTYQAPKRKGA